MPQNYTVVRSGNSRAGTQDAANAVSGPKQIGFGMFRW